MISKMREMAPVIMVIVLVSFVIGTILLDWGMNRGGASGATTNVAGKINGQEIPLTYFDRELESARQNMERGHADDEQLQSRELVRQVWEQQVSQVLLKDYFKKACLFASADEVFDYIKNNPPPGVDTNSNLMTDGKFDTAKYIAVLNDPRTYEYNPGLRVLEQQTRELIIPSRKLELLLTAPLVATRAELEHTYKAENEKAIFEYAYINAAAVRTGITDITEGMVADYYAAHQDSFQTEEMIDLYAVSFLKKAKANDTQMCFEELVEIRNRLLADKEPPRPEAFAEEAMISSDDEGSAQNGGDIGFVRRGVMDREFERVAFSLGNGEISAPIKTQFGYHLVYVENKRKVGKTEEVKVRHILRRIVPSIETTDIIEEKADSLRRTMLDEGFAKAAAAASRLDSEIVFDSTGLFPRGAPIPGIGYVSGLGAFLFGLDRKGGDTISERLENKGGYYLFSVTRRVPKGVMPFEAAVPRIRKIIADSLRAAALRSFAEKWVEKVAENTPLASLKKSDPSVISSGVTDTITRMSQIPGIGSNTKVAAVAFALPVGKRSGLIDYNGTYFMVRPLWKGTPAAIDWGSQRTSMVAARMMGELRQQIYMKWYMDYRNRQKITSNLDRIYLD
ncbi:MAG: SurA N-terminal domain-containing protein [Chitinispirillaceae bacterium]|nr:SurA N-terminal domain-containing protein [Chitinispirillaceae bacterium]